MASKRRVPPRAGTDDVVVGLGEVGEGVLEGEDGRGELGKLQDGAVKLDQDGAVVWAGEHGGEEGAAGGDLVRDVGALAAAGVDHEGEGERKAGALREGGDGLGLAVLLEEEVVTGEVGDGLAGFVADDGGDGDELGGDFEGGGVGGEESGGLRERGRERGEENERE